MLKTHYKVHFDVSWLPFEFWQVMLSQAPTFLLPVSSLSLARFLPLPFLILIFFSFLFSFTPSLPPSFLQFLLPSILPSFSLSPSLSPPLILNGFPQHRFWSYLVFYCWRRQWQPTAVLLPGESQGGGSLVGCRLLGPTESDTTEAT